MENTLIELNFVQSLKRNLEDKNQFLQVLIGPRQIGKTTTILKMLKDYFQDKYIFYSADGVFNANAKWIVEIWQEAHLAKKILVIDEIQKIENWQEIIKKLWDEDKRKNEFYGCLLVGSSSLAIQKGLSESLAGRFQLHYAYHWNFDESNRAYHLEFDDYIKKGGYPGSYFFSDENEWADYIKRSIVLTVIEKDILQNNNVKKPALFKQVFELIMAYPAMEISYTKLLGQIQESGNVELVKYYLSLYEGAFLIKLLEKYSGNQLVTKSSSPKILPLAPCFYYLEIRDDYRPEEYGRAFEVLVGMQLARTEEKLYYWREGKDEVDYVLKKGRRLFAIEVKSGRKKSEKGLLKFKEKFPNATIVIINKLNYVEFEKDPISFLSNLQRDE